MEGQRWNLRGSPHFQNSFYRQLSNFFLQLLIESGWEISFEIHERNGYSFEISKLPTLDGTTFGSPILRFREAHFKLGYSKESELFLCKK